MEYTTESDRIIVRLDPGEEVLDSLTALRADADIEQGFLMGIGAVDEVTLGHYDVSEQEYNEETFTGQCEVTSFFGKHRPRQNPHTHSGGDGFI